MRLADKLACEAGNAASRPFGGKEVKLPMGLIVSLVELASALCGLLASTVTLIAALASLLSEASRSREKTRRR